MLLHKHELEDNLVVMLVAIDNISCRWSCR